MAVIQCTSCGAPLEVDEGIGVVVCQYCKAQNLVAKAQPSVHVHVYVQPPVVPVPTPVPPPVPTPVPPPVMDPSPVVEDPPEASASASRAGLVVGLSIMLALVGVAVAVAVQHFGGPSYGYWTTFGTCPVDANGDGVDDVAGLARPPDDTDTHIPTIVDGTNGEELWRGETVGKGARLECLDRQWFVVGADDFELRLHDARRPDAPHSLRGRDQLQAAAMGKGCAALQTADGTVMGVALPAGTPTECKAEFPSPFEEPGIIGNTGETTTVSVGKRRVTLTKRSAGTPVLTLRVEEEGKTTLERELPSTAATFSSGIAMAGDRIVLFATLPATRDQGMLIGLDAKTGTELYAVPLEGQVTNHVTAMFFNGRHVVLHYWTYLRAYDPATGEPAW